jgi:hypothetical protein
MTNKELIIVIEFLIDYQKENQLSHKEMKKLLRVLLEFVSPDIAPLIEFTLGRMSHEVRQNFLIQIVKSINFQESLKNV